MSTPIVEIKKRCKLTLKQSTKLAIPDNSPEPDYFSMWRRGDEDFIRAWPMRHPKGPERELLIRRDAIGWATEGIFDQKGSVIVGLRNAGAAPIPIVATWEEFKEWWLRGRRSKMSERDKG